MSVSSSYIRLNNRIKTILEHLNLVHESLDAMSREKRSAGSLARHAITRNSELAVQLLYTHLVEYLRSIVREMYDQKPLQIVNKVSLSLSYTEIVKLGSYDAIKVYMVDHVFRTFENQRSTKSLIEKIIDRTGIVIESSLLENALFYLEIRHLIVHNSSVFDNRFVENYQHKFAYVQDGKKIPISIGLARKSLKALQDLCHDIDKKLVEKNYLKTNS